MCRALQPIKHNALRPLDNVMPIRNNLKRQVIVVDEAVNSARAGRAWGDLGVSGHRGKIIGADKRRGFFAKVRPHRFEEIDAGIGQGRRRVQREK